MSFASLSSRVKRLEDSGNFLSKLGSLDFEEEKAKLQNSFYEFAKAAWPIIDGAPFIDNWHIGAICEHLQYLETNNDVKNILFNIGPRTMKTLLIVVMFQPWVWIRRPSAQFLYVHNSPDLANMGAVKSRGIITSDFYKKRWSKNYSLSSDENLKSRYSNTRNGYRLSCPVLGQITGKGGDYVVLDDLNHALESSEKRKRIIDIFKSVLFNRVNDPKTSKRIVLQQRTSKGDLSDHIIGTDIENGWAKVILPMEFDVSRKSKTIILPSTNGKIWEDPRKKDGELLWPNRINEDDVRTFKSVLGKYFYDAQYNQNPQGIQGGLILREDFKVWSKPLPVIKFMVQSWDTALTNKNSSDYSACTTWGTFADENGVINVILLYAWHDKVSYPKLLERAKRLKLNCADIEEPPLKPDKHNQPDISIIEATALGHPIISDLNTKGIVTHSFNPGKYGDKTLRVNLCSPFIQCGRIWVIGDEKGNLRSDHEKVVDECTLYPNGGNDDLVDTMTQAILYLSKERGILTHSMNLNFDREKLPKEHMPGYKPPKEGNK
jgi:hypothetical protein